MPNVCLYIFVIKLKKKVELSMQCVPVTGLDGHKFNWDSVRIFIKKEVCLKCYIFINKKKVSTNRKTGDFFELLPHAFQFLYDYKLCISFSFIFKIFRKDYIFSYHLINYYFINDFVYRICFARLWKKLKE